MAGKVDNWSELERMYVVDGKSHREIARIADISNSTVSQKAKRDDWEGKRLAYQASLNRRGYELAAAEVANEQHLIVKENVLVSRAYIRTFAQQLAEGKVTTNAKDALSFMQFLAETFDATKGEGLKDGPKVIEGSAVSVGDNADLVRRVVEAARSRRAPAGGVDGGVLGRPEGTLPN